MPDQTIPLVKLDTLVPQDSEHYATEILENEIRGIHVEHVALTGKKTIVDPFEQDCRTTYLFISGNGHVEANNSHYELVPETIFLPNAVDKITINAASNETLHYLKVISRLSAQDKIDIQSLPKQNTQSVYHAKFSDCQSYSEAIKSPNTVSRTILSNEFIPRIAMGTVQTKGPDRVAAHEHPMLEQLFLGLSDNNCNVHADDAKVEFPQHSLLHIPLGSRHSVSVENDKILYYVWMDFFLDKAGEAWLDTHKVDSNQ